MPSRTVSCTDVEVGSLPWKGTVEDVGLRRTTIRGFDGTVYPVSNGELRTVANRTRVYAAAEVKVRGIEARDLRRVIELMDRVGAEVAGEAEFAESVIEMPTLKYVEDPDDLGVTAIMRGRVVAEGIELNKRVIKGRRG